VLRSSVESKAPLEELRTVTQEQLQNMNEIVEYQLHRAAAAGRTALSAPLPVAPVARKIITALEKVYAAKSLQMETAIAPDAMFRGDEGDLLEILGNIADNAFKWAHSRIRVEIQNQPEGQPGLRLILRIEDDGPGIPDDQIQLVRARGARADTTTPGHGLGLAVVQEIVELYRGKLVISRSSFGGAAVEVRL